MISRKSQVRVFDWGWSWAPRDGGSPGLGVKNTALGPNAVSLLEDEPEEILEDHKELDYESSDDILDLEL